MDPANQLSSQTSSSTGSANKRTRVASSPSKSKTSDLFINELLCYFYKKFGSANNKSLKQVIVDFYDGKQISEAKDILTECLSDLNLANWIKPPRRRKDSLENAGAKARTETEDLLNMFIFIDTNALNDQLPRFVAADPDNIPSPQMASGDIQCILNKINSLSEQNASIQTSVEEFTVAVSSKVQNIIKVLDSAPAGQNQLASSRSTSSTYDNRLLNQSETSSMNLVGPATSQWPPLFVHTPSVSTSVRNLHVNSRQNLVNMDLSRGDVRYSDIVNNRHHVTSMVTLNGLQNLPRSAIEAGNNVDEALVRTPSRRSRLTVLGSSNSSIFKAANTLQIKKSVYRLGNVSADYNCEDVSNYIKSLNVRLINCFELPRRQNQPSDNKHFRVCIASLDKHILLDKNNWDMGIVVQDWIFHPKKNNEPKSPSASTTATVPTSHSSFSKDVSTTLSSSGIDILSSSLSGASVSSAPRSAAITQVT